MMMLRLLPLLIFGFAPAAALGQAMPPEDPAIHDPYTGWRPKQERVVILHDLFEMPMDTNTLERAFLDAGFKTDNLGYNPLSTRKGTILPKMVSDMAARLAHYDKEKVHFACHAYGCALMHALIARHRPANLGRVVMFAKPWQSTWLTNKDMPWVEMMLASDRLDGPNRLLAEDLLKVPQSYEVAILTGSRQVYARKVQPMLEAGSVHTAYLPAFTQPVTMRVADADQQALTTAPEVLAMAVHYIENGSFPNSPPKN